MTTICHIMISALNDISNLKMNCKSLMVGRKKTNQQSINNYHSYVFNAHIKYCELD